MYNAIYKVFSAPFGYAIKVLYDINGQNYLLAILIFAILVKLVLLPTSISTQKNSVKSKRMQARINKIKQKYANDQTKMQEEIQAFYKKEGYGSMGSGCGALLIQFPIIIGLYGAIYNPLSYILRVDKKYGKGTITALTDAVKAITGDGNARTTRVMEINVLSHIDELKGNVKGVSDEAFAAISDFATHFHVMGFNFGDIPQQIMRDNKAVLIVPILAFVFAMLSSIYSLIRTRRLGNDDMSQVASMGCMMLFMPFMSLWLAMSFPVGIGVYWAINSLLGVLQMVLLDAFYTPDKVIAKIMVDESIERRQKELVVKNNAN